MMLSRIIFCTAVSLAILAVILLAMFSPVPHRKQSKSIASKPSLALSLYIQQPKVVVTSNTQPEQYFSNPGAFIFHRMLTEGPENTSRVVGKAQGFIIPIEHFAHSTFNIIYLSFNTPEHSGSLSVQAKHFAHKEIEQLTVVGGTGSFAFARGLAILTQTDQQPSSSSDVETTYHVKLQLRFPNRSQTIPG